MSSGRKINAIEPLFEYLTACIKQLGWVIRSTKSGKVDLFGHIEPFQPWFMMAIVIVLLHLWVSNLLIIFQEIYLGSGKLVITFQNLNQVLIAIKLWGLHKQSEISHKNDSIHKLNYIQ